MRPSETFDFCALTALAGALDALSYLRGRAFTANMTGNTVLLGVGILGHHRERIVPCLIALAAFLTGAALAAAVLLRTRAGGGREADLRSGLLLEMPALVVFCAVWLLDPRPDAAFAVGAMLASAGCALGVQSVAVRRLKISGVVTTFITGTLTTAVVEAVSKRGGERQKEGRPILLAAMFAIYLVSAAAAAALYDAWRSAACFLPLAPAAAVFIRGGSNRLRVPARPD